MYGSVRIEFDRQKSQNSISTGLPSCRSICRGAELSQRSPGGNGGAAMWSTSARTATHGRSPLDSGLDQAALDRVANQLDAVAHPELAQHVGPVGLDGLLGQVQHLRDLRIGVGLGDQLD